ncbi:MAG: hydroxymethylbilane synthase, partial [Myxococcaceae bacterium]
AAVPERVDARDAFVSPRGMKLVSVPHGAWVGTSSLRRTCQLLERRPDLKIVSLRGNVQTRLRKTEEEGLAGAVLAFAGLRRLGLEGKVTQVIAPEVSLPAVGQGVLAIQSRADDREVRSLLDQLEHAPTRYVVTAERAFLEKLEGGCSVPMAGFATLSGQTLRMRGLVGKPDGSKVLRAELSGLVSEGAQLGYAVAEKLLASGAREFLQERGP